MLIGPEHQAIAMMVGQAVRVERRPTETRALFMDEGHFKITTSNGTSFAEGPVWILWDTEGYPYPITPEEFEKLYIRKGAV